MPLQGLLWISPNNQHENKTFIRSCIPTLLVQITATIEREKVNVFQRDFALFFMERI